jgi:hypothetical protein
MRQLRALNDERITAVVAGYPGVFSAESVALRLLPNTVRSAIKRDVVTLRDRRLYP